MVLKYPGATWDPLGTQTEPRMRSHDILCFHTMVGSLAGTSSMFHANGYGGTESHFGVGESKRQGIKQWQDLMYQADANLDGGHRVTSIETADYGGIFGKWNTNDASKVPAWSADQLDMLVDLTVWWCKKSTHRNCPSTWKCHQVGVPAIIIPDTRQGRRGLGYHRQGCKPNVVSGGELWSSAYGKVCPAWRREAQLKTIIAPRVQKILAGSVVVTPPPTPTPAKDWFDMATPAEIEAAQAKGTETGLREYLGDFYSASGTGTAVWNTQKAILSENKKQTAALERIATALEALKPPTT